MIIIIKPSSKYVGIDVNKINKKQTLGKTNNGTVSTETMYLKIR